MWRQALSGVAGRRQLLRQGHNLNPSALHVYRTDVPDSPGDPQEAIRQSLLITGGSGFIGQALIKRLADQPLRLASRADAAAWHKALVGITTVVHLAARVHVMHDASADPLAAFRAVNVDGTLTLARQAAAAGVKRFVFVSSVKVTGEYTLPGKAFTEADAADPQDAYGVSKHEAELGLRQIAGESGMEVVIIRPPLVYGPGVKANFAALMRAVQGGWPLPLGAVHNRRSLVALDNLVDFIVTCLSHPQAANQTFLVSDGNDLSTPELVRGLTRAAGVSARLLPVPVWALRAGASLLGKGEAIQRVCGNLQVDISKARSLLGWVPPVSVDEGLRRAVAGMQKP